MVFFIFKYQILQRLVDRELDSLRKKKASPEGGKRRKGGGFYVVFRVSIDVRMPRLSVAWGGHDGSGAQSSIMLVNKPADN